MSPWLPLDPALLRTRKSATDDPPRQHVDGTELVWSRTSEAWVCQTCGGLVADYVKHGKWHA